jgi:hypothetical protein
MIYSDAVEDAINASDRKLLFKTSDLLWKAYDKMKDCPKKKQPTFHCHSICRALCLAIPDGSVRCVDGRFIGFEIADDLQTKTWACAHSWLVTQSGTILDPYPVGIMSIAPILVFAKGAYKPFGAGHYREDIEVRQEFSLPETWRKARVLSKLLV